MFWLAYPASDPASLIVSRGILSRNLVRMLRRVCFLPFRSSEEDRRGGKLASGRSNSSYEPLRGGGHGKGISLRRPFLDLQVRGPLDREGVSTRSSSFGTFSRGKRIFGFWTLGDRYPLFKFPGELERGIFSFPWVLMLPSTCVSQCRGIGGPLLL
jgi:hypothetical protein